MDRHLSSRERALNQLLIELSECDYQHPLFKAACKQLQIFPELIPLDEDPLKHSEARRKAQLVLVADFILNNYKKPTLAKKAATGRSSPVSWTLKVKSNLKKLKKLESEKNKKILQKNTSRHREVSQVSENLKLKALAREEKIKGIREAKAKEEAQREKEALKTQWTPTMKIQSSKNTPKAEHASLLPDLENPESTLQKIYDKLQLSERRHREHVMQKATHSKYQFIHRSFENNDSARLVQKIIQKNENSKMRRLKILSQERNKAKLRNNWEEKRYSNPGQSQTYEKEIQDKIEMKRLKKLENMNKTKLIVAEKYRLRKHDVDLNIKKNNIIEQLKKQQLLESIYNK